MKKELPWIFLDVDGTIMDSNGNIHNKVKKEIFHFIKEGGKVSLISGRLPEGMFEVIEQLKLENFYHLGANGSVLFKTNEFSSRKVIGKIGTDCKKYAKILQKIDVPFFYCFDDRIEFDFDKEKLKKIHINHFKKVKEPNPIYSKNIKHNKVIKILIFIEETKIEDDKKIREVLAMYSDKIDVVRCSENAIEVMPKNINKGIGAKKIIDDFEHSIENTIACGDNENDLSLLRTVGKAYIVKNAKISLKNSNFKEVGFCQEGGVAEIFKEIREGDCYE